MELVVDIGGSWEAHIHILLKSRVPSGAYFPDPKHSFIKVMIYLTFLQGDSGLIKVGFTKISGPPKFWLIQVDIFVNTMYAWFDFFSEFYL